MNAWPVTITLAVRSPLRLGMVRTRASLDPGPGDQLDLILRAARAPERMGRSAVDRVQSPCFEPASPTGRPRQHENLTGGPATAHRPQPRRLRRVPLTHQCHLKSDGSTVDRRAKMWSVRTGEPALLRHVLRGRVGWVLPVNVVEDTSDRVALFRRAGTPTKRPGVQPPTGPSTTRLAHRTGRWSPSRTPSGAGPAFTPHPPPTAAAPRPTCRGPAA